MQVYSKTASTRILRLAFGTTLSLWISQVFAWDLSFIAPIITLVLLAMPLSRPPAKLFIFIVVAISVSVYAGFIFLPLLLHQQLAGLLLVGLALFHSFYFTARGGTAVVGTLATIGLALTVAIGTVSVDALLLIANGLIKGTLAGSLVAMLSHAIITDAPRPPHAKSTAATAATVDLAAARGHAMRALAVVAPILIWFLLSAASVSNMAVLIKVSAMGQEVSLGGTRSAAKSLIISTLAGGLAAVIAWQVLSIWPSLVIYALLIALAGMFFGWRIFSGEGLHSDAATWSYAYLTMITVLGPAVVDGAVGSNAGAGFTSRLFMFMGATLYAVVVVYVFDAFWPRAETSNLQASTDVAAAEKSVS